jgi:hypothetical protein
VTGASHLIASHQRSGRYSPRAVRAAFQHGWRSEPSARLTVGGILYIEKVKPCQAQPE